MTASTFPGFGAGTKRLPVPASLLSTLLADITDCAELKCTLRFLWYEALESGAPRRVAVSSLRADDVLLNALGSEGEVERGIALAVERGTLIEAGGWLLLHTPQNERAAGRTGPAPSKAEVGQPSERPNIFQLYEENIGMLTPLIADELRETEDEYPYDWIEDAIYEAVAHNARSWRYVVRVLDHWKKVGKGQRSRGKPSGHTETLTAEQILARLHRS